ncbi:MAG TPA: hypothetical protein H9830_01135, partial [Candidatus Agrococcus pullicola]|nr:hypothetical protein [Candidatus Agrococcus pullicola]
MPKVKTRRYIAAAAAIGIALAATGCSSGGDADAEGQVTWSLAHVFPESSAVHTAAVALSEQAPEITDGRVNFTVFPGGQLGGDEELGQG